MTIEHTGFNSAAFLFPWCANFRGSIRLGSETVERVEQEECFSGCEEGLGGAPSPVILCNKSLRKHQRESGSQQKEWVEKVE